MPTSVEKTGKTVQDAIHEALEALGVTADDENVVIEVLDEGENKLFGRRHAKVRVTLDTDQPGEDTTGDYDEYEDEEDYADEAEDPSDAGEITYEGDPETPEEADATAFVAKVLSGIGLSAKVSVSREDGTIRVDAACDDCGAVIGRRGETLDAIQYLASLAVNRSATDRVRVVVDIGGYRRRREEALVKLAERVAEKVVSSGRSSVLEAMNPAERRIIHSTLQDFDGVTTYSEGEDPNRRVVVAPRED